MEFVKGSKASELSGLCQQTLRKYAKEGIIESRRLPSGNKFLC